MSPRPGAPAPLFEKRSVDGELIRLSDLRGRHVVLVFYPRAGSAGCSIEAQRFETALPEFERLGAVVIGVSTDTEARQARFRDTCHLTFPLLPDSDRSVCHAYGVLGVIGGLLNMAARETVLIDPQGVIAARWRNPNPAAHVPAVLRALGSESGHAPSAVQGT
ncbi:peroxiredoxin Q/BCP [Deinococcus metalli]|uniref:thioredoxin-dependent peroxiredoxin n=1 Tax=Deinococcus metalli TaxID=1141878 RepID=A0A7W8KEH5_9DEIO|nr:peroxiredoxin [Deinococcus metalli]MBB5375541.1 peroxiredoxin Q/BCP [Deinococcus metalli]GHF28498.1 peroxiredoxin [Deinococcus metalli]